MIISIDGRRGEFSKPVTVGEASAALVPESLGQVLGCFRGGSVLELNDVLTEDARLRLITFADEEGRRIYERSLRFVFLMAAERRFPDEAVRIEHSIGHGIYVEMQGRRLTTFDIVELEAEMRDIIQQDLPFVRRTWSREKAIAYFEGKGASDTARLLRYRPYDFFTIYECGEMAEYFYGAMLPSTGRVPVFALRVRAPGLVVLLPSAEDPLTPARYLGMPKHMAAFAQSNYWCKVLDCVNAADLNDLIAHGRLRQFIRVNEAFHDKSLAEIAQDVINMDARVIFIAGPSSSGKTTFANRLSIHLRVGGCRPVIISLDDFYFNREDLPLEADGRPDLEALDALDVPLFRRCIQGLLAGRETLMPSFDFNTQRRREELKPLRIGHLQPLIIEGIHGLNPSLHEGFDPALILRIYVSELTSLNLDDHNRIRTTDARLLRRIVRDHLFRNTPPLKTLEMWDSVRRGEEKWIFPFQERADIVFNSALHYELPVLKSISFDILRHVPEEDPSFVKCNRILKILNYLLPAPPDILDEIPPLSILREFIGGNTLYLHPQEG